VVGSIGQALEDEGLLALLDFKVNVDLIVEFLLEPESMQSYSLA
jgi:hypothetical protein